MLRKRALTVAVAAATVLLLTAGSYSEDGSSQDNTTKTVASKTAAAPSSNPREFTYRLDTSKWFGNMTQPRDYRHETESLQKTINSTLNDPRGWVRANLKFKPTTAEDANITITVLNQKNQKEASACSNADPGLQLDGCGAPSLNHCHIWLVTHMETKADRSGFSYAEPKGKVVQHELGHCFGCWHTYGGLMNRFTEGMDPYPSEGMIDNLKKRKRDIFRRLTPTSCDKREVNQEG